jgi:hypothetical protein
MVALGEADEQSQRHSQKELHSQIASSRSQIICDLTGATELRKQLSVVTDRSEGVYRPKIVLGKGRHTMRVHSPLQISHPSEIKFMIQLTQQQEFTP